MINAFGTTASAIEGIVPRRSYYEIFAGDGFALACLIFMASSKRKRLNRLWMVVLLCAGLSATVGCGSSSSSAPGTPAGPTIPATAGGYSVTVTGVSGGIIHSETVSVQVQ
jgi:hypothetical protein